jgi:mRNA interferase RelE/StbE
MPYPNFSNYTIIFSKSADKFLGNLNKETKQKILKKVRALQTSDDNLDIKKLKSHHALYRLRIGNFRIIYTMKHERKVIYIVAIGLRKDIYEHSFFA